jgi:hypothetical protein
MKFRLTVNETFMMEGSAQKILNALVSCLQSRPTGEEYRVRVEYLAKDGKWKLENGVVVK